MPLVKDDTSRHLSERWPEIILQLGRYRLSSVDEPENQAFHDANLRRKIEKKGKKHYHEIIYPLIEFEQNLAQDFMGVRDSQKIVLTLNELDRRGIIIVRTPTVEPWRPAQSHIYELKRKTTPLRREVIRQQRVPINHLIIMDAIEGTVQ
ncbi:hypothetical protein GOV10_02975, partial [Candidatus Woesearchaeota archaeon]|nr:hypothetical protein [Candidatus Woesearchaeota archaeon]